MIKINLLGDDTAVDNTGKLWVAGYVASLVLFGLVFFGMYRSVTETLNELADKQQRLEIQLARLKETTKEVSSLEVKRRELNDKLAVIAGLKRNKSGPVRVLDDLNAAIPERAWLTLAKESGGLMRLVGLALDNQTISTFMKDLESSDYFERVELVETKQVDRKGVKIKEFNLDTKINYIGKLELPGLKAAAAPGIDSAGKS